MGTEWASQHSEHSPECRSSWSTGTPLSRQRAWFLGAPVWSRGVDSRIPVSPFQLRIHCGMAHPALYLLHQNPGGDLYTNSAQLIFTTHTSVVAWLPRLPRWNQSAPAIWCYMGRGLFWKPSHPLMARRHKFGRSIWKHPCKSVFKNLSQEKA